MTEKSKRTAGAVLLATALLLAITGWLMWSSADTSASVNETTVDHTGSIVLLGIAGLSVVCGVIFTAVSKPDPALPTKAQTKKPAPKKPAT